jgi:MraZ protein
MSSFKGRYRYAVDEKGRIAIPAKLRKNIAPASRKNFVVTRGLEKCLYLYPLDEWNKLEQSLRSLSLRNDKDRQFARTISSWAEDAGPDGQFRIMLSAELKQYAGITEEVLVLGVLERIEIWSPAVLDAFEKDQSQSYESAAEQVFAPKP